MCDYSSSKHKLTYLQMLLTKNGSSEYNWQDVKISRRDKPSCSFQDRQARSEDTLCFINSYTIIISHIKLSDEAVIGTLHL